MTTEAKKELWGEFLFNVFEKYLDDEGWLTEEWAEIIEENYSDWDEDYNDTNNKKEIYSRMYNVDFESDDSETRIRPEYNL